MLAELRTAAAGMELATATNHPDEAIRRGPVSDGNQQMTACCLAIRRISIRIRSDRQQHPMRRLPARRQRGWASDDAIAARFP